MITDSSTLHYLQHHTLFGRLSASALRDISAMAVHLHLAKGHNLFLQGDTGTHFYLMLNGQITLGRTLSNGQEKLVELIQPGDTFGEDVLFSNGKIHPMTANALKNSEIIGIESAGFRRVLEQQPMACMEMLYSLTRRLHQRLDEIDSLISPSASRRVARFLCDENTNGAIQLKISKRLVASKLGVTPETFSRVLHKLIDDGLIAMERRNIRIIDTGHLLRYCE